MGGRGAGSGVPTANSYGGGGGGGIFSRNGVGFQNYDTLKDAIGNKGKVKSMNDATLNSNPHYDKTGTYREFTENCQRVVVAYEARRRGYDVTAQPTYQNDNLGKAAYINPNTGVRNSYWMGAFKGAKPEAVGARTAQKARNNLEEKMKSYGSGSRAIMQLQWNSGGGHVINIENINGNIHYRDGQIGAKYNPKKLFENIKSNNVQITRVDNLKFSDRAKKSITKDRW